MCILLFRYFNVIGFLCNLIYFILCVSCEKASIDAKKSLGCFFFFEVILLTESLLASPDTDNKRITATMATHAAVAESVLQSEKFQLYGLK